MSINQATVSGNVGNAEIKYTSSGLPVLTFSVAVNEYRKDKDDYTSWISCVMMGSRAEKLSEYITKGAKVCVSGRIHENRWEDKNGNKRSRVEIHVNDVEFMSNRNGASNATKQASNDDSTDIYDVDIPF